MAWNPSKEVAAARDAARALGDAPICVVLWVSPDGKNLGMASYGKTKALCSSAAKLGDYLYDEAMNYMLCEDTPAVGPPSAESAGAPCTGAMPKRGRVTGPE